MLSQLPDLLPVSIVTHIDMDLVRVRILHKCTGIDGLVEKLWGFIVSGDEHIHMRELVIKNVRQWNLIITAFHPVDHQFYHSQRSHCLCRHQRDTGNSLQYPLPPWQCKENPPDQIDRQGNDRYYEPSVSFVLIRHVLRLPFSCLKTPTFSVSGMRKRIKSHHRSALPLLALCEKRMTQHTQTKRTRP